MTTTRPSASTQTCRSRRHITPYRATWGMRRRREARSRPLGRPHVTRGGLAAATSPPTQPQDPPAPQAGMTPKGARGDRWGSACACQAAASLSPNGSVTLCQRRVASLCPNRHRDVRFPARARSPRHFVPTPRPRHFAPTDGRHFPPTGASLWANGGVTSYQRRLVTVFDRVRTLLPTLIAIMSIHST
jgi:hypothetical protein